MNPDSMWQEMLFGPKSRTQRDLKVKRLQANASVDLEQMGKMWGFCSLSQNGRRRKEVANKTLRRVQQAAESNGPEAG